MEPLLTHFAVVSAFTLSQKCRTRSRSLSRAPRKRSRSLLFAQNPRKRSRSLSRAPRKRSGPCFLHKIRENGPGPCHARRENGHGLCFLHAKAVPVSIFYSKNEPSMRAAREKRILHTIKRLLRSYFRVGTLFFYGIARERSLRAIFFDQFPVLQANTGKGEILRAQRAIFLVFLWY